MGNLLSKGSMGYYLDEIRYISGVPVDILDSHFKRTNWELDMHIKQGLGGVVEFRVFYSVVHIMQFSFSIIVLPSSSFF